MTSFSLGSPFCDGVSRRHLLKAGVLGLTVADLRRLQAATGTPPRKTAVIFVELAGGPTQHETYDPKPLAPSEFRGPLGVVGTNVAGITFSELMAEQARIADKLAVIRSITHDSGSHGTSSHLTQTGYYLRNKQNLGNEMPCVGSVVSRLRGSNTPGLPAFVSLPVAMRYGRPAWLGPGHAAFETVNDPSKPNFTVPNISLARGLTPQRLSDRQSLLANLDAARRVHDAAGTAEAVDQFTGEAFEMLSGEGARIAFAIEQESDTTRERYGLNAVGQNMLLARRLVERGVAFVTVRVTGWDDHSKIEAAMKRKGPGYDRGIAALVSDLHDRGMDRDVLVVSMGEFGRTPKVNANAGRDHWGKVMSVMMAGGGLRTGQVVGASDQNGAAPAERPYRPENVLAMVYRHLGIDPSLTIDDHTGRPRHLLGEHGLVSELV
jgi:hypothetical protein